MNFLKFELYNHVKKNTETKIIDEELKIYSKLQFNS